MFEIGKTYGYEDNGYLRNLRVDHIQHVKGGITVAVGVTLLDGGEIFDWEFVGDFKENGWREL